jgi:protein O-mannosyl-transferase
MSKRKIGVNPIPEKEAAQLFTESKLLRPVNLVAVAIIVVVALGIFWNTMKNGFTDWDDDLYVVNSELIRQLDWNSFKAYFTTLTANLYTPLVTLSYAIDYSLFGMIPSGFHGVNLFLHCCNIILVFILTFKLFGRTFIAAATALLFAIHPLQAEAVVWISSRKDLLFTLFYLIGLITYLRYLEKKRIYWLVITFVLFVLSVLSKPIAFTFPFALLWIDYFRHKKLMKYDLLVKIPFFVITVLIGIMGIYLVNKYEVFATAPEGYTWFDKICLAGYALAFDLYNAVVPAGISNYHAYPFKDGSVLDVQYLLAPVFVLLMLFLIYRTFKKHFIVTGGLILFLIMIGPTLRLVPTGYPIAADRYFYLASVGLFWFLILAGEKLSEKSFALKAVVIVLGFALVMTSLIVSYRRVPEWKDSHRLWTSTLRKDPYHEVANDHLGRLYDNAGNKDQALFHFRRVAERNKTKYDVMNSIGNILVDKNQPDLALEYYDLAIATGKADHLPYYNRGMVLADKKELAKAIDDFGKALERKADFAEAYNNRGIAKVKSGDTLGALADFTEAVRLKPSDRMMQDNLTRITLLLNQK